MNFALQLAISFMITAGTLLRNRDANTTGADDVVGTILVDGAQALQAYVSPSTPGNQSAFRRALTAIRDTISAFLAETAS